MLGFEGEIQFTEEENNKINLILSKIPSITTMSLIDGEGNVTKEIKGRIDEMPDGTFKFTEAKMIFVFGANLAGRHGKGAALYARQHHGAIYGQGIGLQGNSYAIPTKDENIMTLPLATIKQYVDEFIEFAKQNPEMQFNVTAIGCGLAGYKPEQIAPMFKDAPENCLLPEEFKAALERK